MNLGGVVHVNKTALLVIMGCAVLLILYMSTNGDAQVPNISQDKINLKNLLKTCIESTQNGGLRVLAMKDNITIGSKGKTKEGANDGVTTADLESHCVMKATLKQDFPEILIISEEAQAKCKERGDERNAGVGSKELTKLEDVWVQKDDVNVWIDPLDATQEYTEKLYEYVTTMACITIKGKPIIGVIHKPFTKETFWGWIDKGTSSNLQIKAEHKSNQIRVIISRSHTGQMVKTIQNKFKNYNVTNAGGAGYKVLKVLNGEYDVYLHQTAIKKWDICAGNALLYALRGNMTTFAGEVIDYSDKDHVVNEKGLVASLKNHMSFLKRLET